MNMILLQRIDSDYIVIVVEDEQTRSYILPEDEANELARILSEGIETDYSLDDIKLPLKKGLAWVVNRDSKLQMFKRRLGKPNSLVL